jgi:uncharacterized damage-inducible protein DinB
MMAERGLIELLYGKGAHANPVACVEDVPLALAGRSVEGFPHSIWQLVGHLNYWMDYEAQRIEGAGPKYPDHATESWPAKAAPGHEQEWNNAVSRFKEMLGKLIILAEGPTEELAHEVAPTHPDHATHASTMRDVLWQTLVHNSYHVGQIAMLRRCLGAWPPRGGGDTW